MIPGWLTLPHRPLQAGGLRRGQPLASLRLKRGNTPQNNGRMAPNLLPSWQTSTILGHCYTSQTWAIRCPLTDTGVSTWQMTSLPMKGGEGARPPCCLGTLFSAGPSLIGMTTSCRQSPDRTTTLIRPVLAGLGVEGLPMTTVAQVENPELPKIQRQQRVPTNRLRDIEAGARESISVINYSATMTELMTLFHAAITDLRAFAPPAHLPNMELAKSSADAHFDTMASVLVRLSQANSLHAMGNLWRGETAMQNLSPQLERTRRQFLRNSSFLDPGLFDPSLISEVETYLLAAQKPPQQRRRHRSPSRHGMSRSGSTNAPNPPLSPFTRVPVLLLGFPRIMRLTQRRKPRTQLPR